MEYKTHTNNRVFAQLVKKKCKERHEHYAEGTQEAQQCTMSPLPKTQITSSILKMIEHMKRGECYLANITHTPDFKGTDNLFDATHFLIKWFAQKPAYGFYFAQKDVQLASFLYLIKSVIRVMA